MSVKKEFIEFMIDSGVLLFGDFVTKSGRNTPYFINTGNYRTGEQIRKLGSYYARVIKEQIPETPDILFGPAYKGIPLSVAAAAALFEDYGINCEYSFNRKEAKDHGEGSILVGGKPEDGKKIVIIEDVVTAGSSVRETLPLLRAAGDVIVKDMVISVDRMEKGVGGKSATEEIKEEFGIDTHSIVTIKDIAEYAFANLSPELAGRIADYQKEYCVL